MSLSRGTHAQFQPISLWLQEYVKSSVKDDKNVFKPETFLQENHQDSKWSIQNIINHINCSTGPSRCEFPDNLWVN